MLPRQTPVGAITHPADPLGVCKAWINFSGNAGVIQGSYNIASVVRNAGGDYTITFAIPFADANYAFAGMTMQLSSTVGGIVFVLGTPTATSINLITRSSSSTQQDTDITTVAFWGRN